MPKMGASLYVLLGSLAFGIWGLVPIYFHQLDEVDPILILSQRVFWSAIILILIAIIKPKLISFNEINAKDVGLAFVAGLLMNLSWLGFVYATITNNIMAASLAFYITPVMVFVTGFIFFKEKITQYQKISLSLMILAIAVYVYFDKQLPILSLVIAFLFTFYFVAKKRMNTGTFAAIFLEHIVFSPIALIYIWLNISDETYVEWLTLMLAAPLQLLPIFLLSIALLKMPLTKISILQYIEPTLHLALAVWVYHESVSSGQKYAFIIIVLSIIFSLLNSKKNYVNN
ncbi:EamA family transporter [Pseudoalteromonas distincta]|uniref:EamA family transporter n=1 Tax=Pseudoalteromonas distincta TaxID=77608 RepID=UPI0039EB7A76